MSAWLRYSCECLVQVDAGCRCLCECCMSVWFRWMPGVGVCVSAGLRCSCKCFVQVDTGLRSLC